MKTKTIIDPRLTQPLTRQHTRTELIPCAICLLTLGFGKRAVARIAWLNDKTVKKIRRAMPDRPRAHQGAMFSLMHKPDLAVQEQTQLRQMQEWAFSQEWSGAVMTDTPRHWLGHKHRTNLLARKKEARHRAEQTNYYRSNKLRTQLYKILFCGGVSAPMMLRIGCSLDALREHLASQFRDGMAWENHGKVWELDHIKPCTSFDLSTEAGKSACFHYSNLQPLLVTENRQKHASLKWNKRIKSDEPTMGVARG